MSMFASDTQVTLDIPFDPPHTVTLQKLNGRQLVRAQKASFNSMIAEVQGRGGAKVQKDIQTLFERDAADTAKAIAEVQADPLNGYDPYSLLYSGIKAWSVGKPLELVAVVEKTADSRDVTVLRIPAIDDLDEEAVHWFATEVMRLTKPALFLTEEAAKATQKETDAAPPVA